jgi:hypothetical protein
MQNCSYKLVIIKREDYVSLDKSVKVEKNLGKASRKEVTQTLAFVLSSFFSVLGLELKAFHLLCRCSNTSQRGLFKCTVMSQLP